MVPAVVGAVVPDKSRAGRHALGREEAMLLAPIAPYGRAVSGLAALDAVERVGSNSGGTSSPVVIEACTVESLS